MNPAIDWLLEGPPWVRYGTLADLLGRGQNDPEVAAARRAMLEDSQVTGLLNEVAAWPRPPMKSHNDASHPLHRLTFVADLGLTLQDPGISRLAEGILYRQSEQGPFQTLLRIPESYGGTGQEQWGWMLCDSPQLLYVLASFGLADDPRVRAAARHLTALVRENGWPCAVAPAFGKFRGPGRKADPCPYATLLALKALSRMDEWRDGEVCRLGAETLLGLWEQRKERRPYLFAMGTDFAKLKAPLVWYDLIHVTEVLTRFPWLHRDPRLQEMLAVLASKADGQGRFTPESVWMAWKGWEFARKRESSRWVTFLALRVLKRMD